MDQKLKALKVVDLKNILATAKVSVPAKATKADLIARISASEQAVAVYHDLYPSPDSPSSPQPPQDASPEFPPEPILPESRETPSAPQQSPSFSPSVSSDPQPPPTTVDSTPASTVLDPELEKRKQRAARFGIPLVDTVATNKASKSNNSTSAKPKVVSDDPEKLKARAARFGTDFSQQPSTGGKKRNLSTSQIDPEELERRKKRAERFGMAQPVSTK